MKQSPRKMKQMDRLVAGHLQKGTAPTRLPANFSDKIMDRLAFPHLQPLVVRPLISLRGKVGLAVLFALLGAGLVGVGNIQTVGWAQQWAPKGLVELLPYLESALWVSMSILLAVLLLAMADRWVFKRLPTSKNHPFR